MVLGGDSIVLAVQDMIEAVNQAESVINEAVAKGSYSSE